MGIGPKSHCGPSAPWLHSPMVILHPNQERRSCMRGSLRAPLLITALMAVLVAFTTPALTQEKPADTMELIRQKIKADKKLVVGANMDLTESEAKRFWPVY